MGCHGRSNRGAGTAAANKAGLIQSALEQEMPKLDAIPFESEFQYMATLHETPVGKTIYVRVGGGNS